MAQSGAAAEAPSDGDWLPLEVLALTKANAENSIVTIQLTVNKQGAIRGNYTDTKTGKTMVIQDAVDKQTQRVAFTVGDNKSNLIETGLYNPTKDEAPVLVHVSSNKTAQYLLVSMDKENDAHAANETPTSQCRLCQYGLVEWMNQRYEVAFASFLVVTLSRPRHHSLGRVVFD